MSENLSLLMFLFVLLLTQRIGGEFQDPSNWWEPFEDIHDFCSDCNPSVPESPDPLVSYTWETNSFAEPQLYRVAMDTSALKMTPSACASVNDGNGIQVKTAPCEIRFDWHVEQAAWMEVKLSTRNITLHGSLSEFNFPYPDKFSILKHYPSKDTYRLETNSELYEGIRFTWLYIGDTTTPFAIEGVQLVTKVKPLSYKGAYRSSNSNLTRAWYTAAYSVRLNTERQDFNSVLVERGDRVAIQGDGHPTIATALVSFGLYDLIQRVLVETDSGNHSVVDDTIMPYPLYWCLSVLDWWRATGNHAVFYGTLLQDVRRLIDRRVQDFLDPTLDLTWMGWDDRLGNGWCSHAHADDCGVEAHQTFAGLVIRVCRELAAALSVGERAYEDVANKYARIADALEERFRNEFVVGLNGMQLQGVHAVANAINAGVLRSSEVEVLVEDVLSDPVTICSESPFNQYWILQALGNIPDMERALASVQMCWTPQFLLTTGCFLENFVSDWTHFLTEGDIAPGLQSACHPWASGVAPWQTHVHGGLEPLLPGYKAVLAKPYVSPRYPFVEATVPTPFGAMSVNATLEMSDKEESVSQVHIIVTSTKPGYIGLYRIIDSTCELSVVRLNGRTVQLPSWKSDATVFAQLAPTKFEALRFVPIEGDAAVTAYYINCNKAKTAGIVQRRTTHSEGAPSVPPFEEADYPVSLPWIDRISKGDGIYRYGTDGYVLLGYDNTTDRISLPGYIQTADVWRHGFPGEWSFIKDREFVGSSPIVTSFLPDPTGPSTSRALGMIGYDQPSGGQRGNVNIIVQVTEPQEYCVSLYFVAKSTVDKHIIRSMDLDTKAVIAPSSLLQNYTSGVWWTLCYNRSVRLRLEDMNGIHVSGVAFSRSQYNDIPEVKIAEPRPVRQDQ